MSNTEFQRLKDYILEGHVMVDPRLIDQCLPCKLSPQRKNFFIQMIRSGEGDRINSDLSKVS